MRAHYATHEEHRVRVRPRHCVAFRAYRRWWKATGLFNEHPMMLSAPRTAPAAKSALDAYVLFDSLGSRATEFLFCYQPVALRQVIIGKAQLNQQIRDWAGGLAECVTMARGVYGLCHEFPWLPEWVWDAVERQGVALARRGVGRDLRRGLGNSTHFAHNWVKTGTFSVQ